MREVERRARGEARRRLLALLPVAAAWPATTRASSYPTRPVRCVVPFGAGSGTDVVARRICESLARDLGAPFVVDNVPGASGQIAAVQVARARPDGYTMFFTTNTTHAANPHLYARLAYDPVRDFQPVTLVAEVPFLLVVRRDHPADTVRDLDRWLRAYPERAGHAHGNTAGQVAGAALVRALNVTSTAVPYRSTPQAIADLVGGQVAFMFVDTLSAQPMLAADRVKALAVTARTRLPHLPQLPTMLEATGVDGLDLVAWTGVFLPIGAPADVVGVLNAGIRRAVEDPEFAGWQRGIGSIPRTGTAEAFADYVRASLAQWGEKVRAAGIEPQ